MGVRAGVGWHLLLSNLAGAESIDLCSIIGISLSNGGTAGGIWMFLAVCFGMFFVMLSMAEMASMSVASALKLSRRIEYDLPNPGRQHQEASITGCPS